jgi:hypothetical protein
MIAAVRAMNVRIRMGTNDTRNRQIQRRHGRGRSVGGVFGQQFFSGRQVGPDNGPDHEEPDQRG